MKHWFWSLFLGLALFHSPVFAAGEKVEVSVKGMSCGHCVEKITSRFASEKAVDQVHVSLEEKKVHVLLKDSQNLSDQRVREILEKEGYEVAKIERTKS